MSKNLVMKTQGAISAEFIETLFKQGKTVFSLNEACIIYRHKKEKTTNFLRSLVNRGILARIKSGTFLILQTGQENTQLTNWPVIAKALSGKNLYFISHYSAMRLHGMTTHPLNHVNITMAKRFRPKTISNIHYQFIYCNPKHIWGLTDLWVTKYEQIRVSDLERTILDSLERPALCGNIIEVIRGIWSCQNKIDWIKLIKYARQYHCKAAIKRLGYILETLELGQTQLKSIEKIIHSKKDYVKLDPDGAKMGSYLKRWHLQININITELKASIWA